MTLVMENFWIYNLIIIIVSAIFLYLAYRKGFVRQLLDVVSLVASYVISAFLCSHMASIFPLYSMATSIEFVNDFSDSLINSILWFVILIFLLRVAYWIVCWCSRKVLKIKALSFINRILGLLLGFIKVVMVLTVITLFLKLPFVENGNLFVQNSILSMIDTYIIDFGGSL